jgi:hypothetical protein
MRCSLCQESARDWYHIATRLELCDPCVKALLGYRPLHAGERRPLSKNELRILSRKAREAGFTLA